MSKKIFLSAFLILVSKFCFSQKDWSEGIREVGESFDSIIKADFNFKAAADTCHVGIYSFSFKIDKKGEVRELEISQNMPSKFSAELIRILERKTVSKNQNFIKYTSKAQLTLLQPVFIYVTNSCTDTTIKLNKNLDEMQIGDKNFLNLSMKILASQVSNLKQSFKSWSYYDSLNHDTCLILDPLFLEGPETKKRSF